MVERDGTELEGLALDVESFPRRHPGLHSDVLLPLARAALDHHERSPRDLDVMVNGNDHSAKISFSEADPRTANTIQRPVVVEYAAIVVAGLVLSKFFGLRITRATRRGSRVDYFVGSGPGHQEGVLEVSGTDDGNLASILGKKRAQLGSSRYLTGLFQKVGYVAVTRFAPRAVTCVERAHPEESGR